MREEVIEIKKAAAECLPRINCAGCPYASTADNCPMKVHHLVADDAILKALALIFSAYDEELKPLTQENKRLREDLEDLQAENEYLEEQVRKETKKYKTITVDTLPWDVIEKATIDLGF